LSHYTPSIMEGNGYVRPERKVSSNAPESCKATSLRRGVAHRRIKAIQKKQGGEEELVNVVKAARLLRMNRSTLRELAYQGRIPGLVIMGSLFFRVSLIERLMNEKTKKKVGDHNRQIRSQS
jgi:hypothetical protein